MSTGLAPAPYDLAECAPSTSRTLWGSLPTRMNRMNRRRRKHSPPETGCHRRALGWGRDRS
ncbi:hypothetical protein SLNWT_6465 [Streptomyces albus]|uniref:Uncharacterized protein n=1 Tax=Streptomyces albus (strain ATCC 21838 / DSM 41398 / FERM P-419 / JCM 4703 / NBRC 107858) TaxID=1081613 RepID=A0A0B5F7P8_STRA4|nr:hypothetical protein SLNWT_6465 [Streptomyces albus]AOU81145.1 hypothetical protein SLNHY_6454 [Streptomyces albus]AYN36843.1 hypothetical protein DUI70_6350 [Streptomyces albus]